MGVDPSEAQEVAKLLGYKVFATELLAFEELGNSIRSGALSVSAINSLQNSQIIRTFSLRSAISTHSARINCLSLSEKYIFGALSSGCWPKGADHRVWLMNHRTVEPGSERNDAETKSCFFRRMFGVVILEFVSGRLSRVHRGDPSESKKNFVGNSKHKLLF